MDREKNYALVTGASSGIGLAIGRELAGAGIRFFSSAMKKKR